MPRVAKWRSMGCAKIAFASSRLESVAVWPSDSPSMNFQSDPEKIHDEISLSSPNFTFTNRSESSNGETNLARESYQHCRLAQQRKPQPLNSPLNHNHPRSFSLVWGRKVFFVVLNQQPPVAVATEMQPWRPRDENKQSEKLRLYSWDFETSRNHRIVHLYVTSLCPLHVFRLCEKFHAQFVPEVECIDCTIAWRYDDHQIRLVGSETLGTSSNCAFYWSRLRFTYRVSLNHRGRLKEKWEMQH